MSKSYIFDFNSWKRTPDKNLLGGKGAGIAEMFRLGMDVPPGFTISTELCKEYYANDKKIANEFKEQLKLAIESLENNIGKKFTSNTGVPLLVSVRSGAPHSMPGMMDTVLNLGINDRVVKTLADSSKNEEFAYDTYARFIKSYGSIVLGIDERKFKESNENKKALIDEYKNIVQKESGKVFPQDPYEQLHFAIMAVLDSWMSDRAVYYRKLHQIPENLGTAINVQAMVFGNMGSDSGTGVVFTRNPSNGDKEFYGEFLINAQGEDVVSGAKTPLPITPNGDQKNSLKELLPDSYNQLKANAILLENHFLDMQDIEFTIEKGKLYILQTRSAKRTTSAAIKIVVDMVEDALMEEKEAIMKIDPNSLHQLLHSQIDNDNAEIPIAKGLPASPGAATGKVMFTSHDVEKSSKKEAVILVRKETSPEDIVGMHLAKGILTVRGGMTSHAAVVARGMGTPCVCGANAIQIDEEKEQIKIGDLVIKKGDQITIDGSDGSVYLGKVNTTDPEFSHEYKTFMGWVEEQKTLGVRANAESALDIKKAMELGAEGIGLCRTEHMFFEPKKLRLIREVICSKDGQTRQNFLKQLAPLHQKDFVDIFMSLKDLPVNIRLLDPPLHEFLPQQEEEKKELAIALGISREEMDNILSSLHEVNPMLGHRGARLGITSPEIYAMQIEAIISAGVIVQKKGIEPNIEIMVPLIANEQELKKILELIKSVRENLKQDIKCQIGTMIELPRAALQAGLIAQHVDYFSFGTNDLTQTTYGISRDDVSSFINEYLEQGILLHDPFVRIDKEGVGDLINIAMKRGKLAKPDLKTGICGEHGGDPESIDFFHNIGMDYVSCSPYRVPIAKLASARAAIKNK